MNFADHTEDMKSKGTLCITLFSVLYNTRLKTEYPTPFYSHMTDTNKATGRNCGVRSLCVDHISLVIISDFVFGSDI